MILLRCFCWTLPRIEERFHWHLPPQSRHGAWCRLHRCASRGNLCQSQEPCPCVLSPHAVCLALSGLFQFVGWPKQHKKWHGKWRVSSYLRQHFLHSLLVGFDIFHFSLKAVLHLILDKINTDSCFPVLDTFIVDSKTNSYSSAQVSFSNLRGLSVSAMACSNSDLVSLRRPFSLPWGVSHCVGTTDSISANQSMGLVQGPWAIFRQIVEKLLPWYILLATWPWCIKRRYGTSWHLRLKRKITFYLILLSSSVWRSARQELQSSIRDPNLWGVVRKYFKHLQTYYLLLVGFFVSCWHSWP